MSVLRTQFKDESASFATMSIQDIKTGTNIREDLGDIEGLGRSIAEHGLLHPLVVQRETNQLIAGYRRIEALKKIGHQVVSVHFVSVRDILRAQVDENRARKDFTFEEEMKIADILEPQLRGEAKKRRLSQLKRGNVKPVAENFGNGKSKRERSTAGQLATYFGESDRQFEMKRAVWKHVAKTPVEERKKIISSIGNGESVKKVLGHLDREVRVSEYAKLAEKIKLTTSDIRLFKGDFRDVLKDVKSESVDAIISDIPYSSEDIHICAELARLSERVLTEIYRLASL